MDAIETMNLTKYYGKARGIINLSLTVGKENNITYVKRRIAYCFRIKRYISDLGNVIKNVAYYGFSGIT